MKTNHNELVIVIGAGIGGLTAAIALQQVGLPVRVFEQVAELGEVGAGLTIWANAVKVLSRLGLDDALAGYAAPLAEGAFRNQHGKVLAASSNAELQKRIGNPGLEIHRASLHKLLLKAAGKDTVTLAARLVSFEQDPDGVTAHFSNGETVRGQVLVGADGIHSVVREQLFGPQPVRYSGYTGWRAVVEYPQAGLPVGESWGRGARFGILPIGSSQVYWYATHNAPAGEKDGPRGRQQDLLDLFNDWHAPIPDLIRSTPSATILRNDIYDRPPLNHWSQGRVTLLGDAAHPMTPNLGQGACQAIEDGLVLAECLVSLAEPAAALRQYEQTRLDRANTLVRQSWQIGRIGQLTNPVACWLRDTALRLTPPGFAVRQLVSVVGYEAGSREGPPTKPSAVS